MPKYTFNSDFATEFEHITPKLNKPTILYLHGFCSTPWGRKPEAVKSFCQEHGVGLLRFEYAGHGSDVGNFEKADFLIWKDQMFEMIDKVVKGDIIVAGSSMGGWLALIAAIERPERIKGVIGLAAAPNFVKFFKDNITPEQKKQLEENGKFVFALPSFSYTITQKFIDTGMTCLLPEDGTLWPVDCPVHLLQGMKDDSMPWKIVPEMTKLLRSERVTVKLLKWANHRLGDDESLNELKSSLANIVNI